MLRTLLSIETSVSKETFNKVPINLKLLINLNLKLLQIYGLGFTALKFAVT